VGDFVLAGRRVVVSSSIAESLPVTVASVVDTPSRAAFSSSLSATSGLTLRADAVVGAVDAAAVLAAGFLAGALRAAGFRAAGLRVVPEPPPVDGRAGLRALDAAAPVPFSEPASSGVGGTELTTLTYQARQT
jgi:hypothetical protein